VREPPNPARIDRQPCVRSPHAPRTRTHQVQWNCTANRAYAKTVKLNPVISTQERGVEKPRAVPGRIAMEPDKNFIRGLVGTYVFSDRPNLRCDSGSGAASRCVPSTRATSRMRVSMVHRFFFISLSDQLSHELKFHHEPRRVPL
jgi:hypothetical protein